MKRLVQRWTAYWQRRGLLPAQARLKFSNRDRLKLRAAARRAELKPLWQRWEKQFHGETRQVFLEEKRQLHFKFGSTDARAGVHP